ncbi:MAG TPA: hypothetical protein VJV78_26220 [Polyangiales bacterium]|nr:hypothetical protein [Polyangiales bacterium]
MIGGAAATAGAAAAGGSGVQPAPGGIGAAGIGPGAAGAAGAPIVSTGAASVLQYHNHANRDGLYVDAAFTRAAAAKIRKDPTFTAEIKGPTYAQPLYFDSPDGKDLVLTATEQNEVSAFAAATGTPVWQRVLAPPGQPGCGGSIRPLGITGTPVIDPASRTLYVAAMTMGGKHQIFALSLADGSTLPGWPIDVGTIKAGSIAFNPATQNQRGALLIVGRTLYVPYGGHFQDCGDYHGWVIGVPLDQPSAPVAFATAALGGGIWAPGGLASDGMSVFAATGNTMSAPGMGNTSPSTWGHGNAVLRLSPQLTSIPESQVADFFATKDWKAHDMAGLDLGSSGPVLFDLPGSTPVELLLALGKSGDAFLLNRGKLGGIGSQLQTIELSDGGIAGGMIQASAVYPTPSGTFAMFRSSQPVKGCKTGAGLYGALKIVAGAPPTMAVAWCAEGNGTGSVIATSPDGMTDSVVWYFAGGRLMGWNGQTGASVYSAAESIGTIDKYQTPIVAKGRLFIAASNAVHAFTLK